MSHDSDYIRTLMMRTVGNFLIITSLFFIGKTFYRPAIEEFRYFYEKQTGKKYLVAASKEEADLVFEKNFGSNAKKGALREGLNRENTEILIPASTDFGIVIPKIAANSAIVPNVDAGNKDEYLEALKHGVAQARGTAYPGEGGHIYLFAHSTDYVWNVGTYNAVFYLLYKLELGDEVVLFFKGQKFVYKVTGKEIIDPQDVNYLTRKTDKEFLTLQTCWPPGTTLKRQLIFAERVAE